MRSHLFKQYKVLVNSCRKFSLKSSSFCTSAGVQSTPKPKFIPENPLISEKLQKKMSEFIYPNDTPVMFLDCEKAFELLSKREKLYSHYLTRASLYGSLIVLVQVSPESPLIFSLLLRVFQSQPFEDLKKLAISECDFTEDEFTAFAVYAAAFFNNMGNYKGFGDTKFVPNLPKEKFFKLIHSSKAASVYPQEIESLLKECGEKIYSLNDGEKHLGFHDVGLTTYFSKNFTKEDSAIVADFLKKMKFESYNNRTFKTTDETGDPVYEVRLASVAKTDDPDVCELSGTHIFNGHKFVITRGDYSELLRKVNENLGNAIEYAANEHQSNMLQKYIESFQTGSMQAHKDGSRFWIKDKGPTVESYIGFIESYRDPVGMRGEFEGFVAVVNKEMSQKFCTLVEQAEEFLPLLPWPSSYEKDKFLRPDFTSLDVVTFGCSGVPVGINIPNYDDIKQSEGFKNVSLGNVLTASFKATIPNYLSKADRDMMEKHKVNSFELQVGLHELLGHGSGKIFKKEANGSFNFDTEKVLHLETNGKITSWYEDGENYDSVFTSLGSPLEECRAECVGLYLCDNPEILKIFGHVGADADDVMYANWLSEAHSGLESLQMFDPKSKLWLQAHCQARFGILQTLVEAGEDFIKLEEVTGEDGKPDLLFTVDRTKIVTVGKPALGKFLQKIQLYKSTADAAAAKAMFDKYTAVTTEGRYPFLKYREIIMARKKPRKVIVQGNTFTEGDDVTLQNYEATLEGMVDSWTQRFPDLKDMCLILEDLYRKDQPFFS